MEINPQEKVEKKRESKFRFPTTVSLLMIIILVSSVLTYIIPAGEFERTEDANTGRTIVVADTYENTERSPIGFWDMWASIFNGIVQAADIIAFIFIVGGVFAVIVKSGAIHTALSSLIKLLNGKEYLFVILVMSAFAVGGATFGMAEETLPFVALLITVCMALKYDRIVAVSIVIVGVYAGYASGPLNPFSTGIAQSIVELPLFSGIGLRIVLMVGALLIAVHHTIKYSKKIKLNPAQSFIYNEKYDEVEDFDMEATLSKQQKWVLLILGVSLAVLVFGILKLGWYLAELSALFLLMGIIIGLVIFKGNFNQVTNEFMDGAKAMTSAALLVGISRAVLVVLEDGQILDTIVYALSIPLQNLHSVFAAWGMFFIQGLINFAIPSSSGQAVVVMPIMGAISDLIDVNRQVSVLAFQAGDGFWNMITPTHPVIMAALGIAGIPFSKWLRFAFPLVVKWAIWTMIILAVAVSINWGPF